MSRGGLPGRRRRRLVILVVLALAAFVARKAGWLDRASEPNPGPTAVAPGTRSGPDTRAGEAAIRAAFEAQRSKVWVQAAGEVVHLLDDDNEGSRHQRWLLELPDGLTLKFAHNIDLAERVPVRRGDALRFRGRYEYNDEGGVIHWTHHDPDGRIDGGWIEHAGRRYE